MKWFSVIPNFFIPKFALEKYIAFLDVLEKHNTCIQLFAECDFHFADLTTNDGNELDEDSIAYQEILQAYHDLINQLKKETGLDFEIDYAEHLEEERWLAYGVVELTKEAQKLVQHGVSFDEAYVSGESL